MFLELMQELHSQFLFHCIWLVSLAVLRREGFVKFTFVWIKTCQLEILGNLVPRDRHIFQSFGLVPCLNMGIEWGHPTVQKVLLRTKKNVFCEPKTEVSGHFLMLRLVFPKRFLSSILKTTITQPILFQTWEYIYGCCGSLKQRWPLIMSHRLETLRRGGSSLIGMISSSRVASQDTNGWNLPRPFSNVCAVFQQITQIQGSRRKVIKKGSGRFQVDTYACIHTYRLTCKDEHTETWMHT